MQEIGNKLQEFTGKLRRIVKITKKKIWKMQEIIYKNAGNWKKNAQSCKKL